MNSSRGTFTVLPLMTTVAVAICGDTGTVAVVVDVDELEVLDPQAVRPAARKPAARIPKSNRRGCLIITS